MTLFLDFRFQNQGGDTRRTPLIYDARIAGGAVVSGPQLPAVPAEHQGAEVVLATHGFNVPGDRGRACLIDLERQLALGPGYLFIGVLWPGDWELGPINYPAEGRNAQQCGVSLASFVDSALAGAAGVSLLSHSLGGRLILQAAKSMRRRVRQIVVTAPAVDSRCIGGGKSYDAARLNADRTTVMASRADNTLHWAYPAGTLAALVLHLDDHPFGTALGFDGPQPRGLPRVGDTRIETAQDHDHGDYYPPSTVGGVNRRASRSIEVMSAALKGAPAAWPFHGRIPRAP